MPQIGPLSPTSELAAVNRLLSAVGEAPISDLINSTRVDVALAAELLTQASIEAQAIGWKFNQEFGMEIAPSGTISWVDSDGTTTQLNVFGPPADLLRFSISETTGQGDLDLVIRPPRKFSGLPQVFYDRTKNRDGLDPESFSVLYIDPIWMFPWATLPETARRYITVRAARQFIEQRVGARELSGYGDKDEAFALRGLYEDQGDEDEFNMFDAADVGRVRLGRRPGVSGYYETRKSPRPI